MENSDFACRICQNTQANQFYKIKEMMFGLRDVFEYVLCAKCGCLQIKDILEDMAKYYPADYRYFHNPEEPVFEKKSNPFARYLRAQRTRYVMYKNGFLGRLAEKIKPMGENIPEYLSWLINCGANLESRILEVGCAGGLLLSRLAWHGFRHLKGLDPYIEKDIALSGGVRIFKKQIFEEKEKYDLILFNHSFEHIAQPFEVLGAAKKLLNADGHILVRIPIVSSLAWELYGTNWVQIDAPRHLFLYSLESLRILMQKTGLNINLIQFDSTDFQFWGSEQYKNDIPLLDERSYYVSQDKSVFTPEQIQAFRFQAKELNEKKRGDQVCLYLTVI
jgi:SAM-dependent methyltransferase